jgi:hypothetical protein
MSESEKIRRQCATPGCAIQFLVSESMQARQGGLYRTICLICESKDIMKNLQRPRAKEKVKLVCKKCGKEVCSLAPYSSSEQSEGECYDCFAKSCWESNKKLISSSGPVVEEKEKKELTFPIFIKSLTGKTITLDLRKDDLVYDVMMEIKNKEGMPYGSYMLVFGGDRLMPHRSLSSYNVKQESTLHLISNLRGS